MANQGFPLHWLVLPCLLIPTIGSARTPFELTGTIIEHGNNRPVADAEVFVEVTDMRIRRQVARESTQTDFAGRYRFDFTGRFEDFPSLGLQVNAISPLHRENLRIRIIPREEFPATIDLELAPGCTAEGVVLDEENRPVANARVQHAGGRSVETDSEGRFVIPGLAAETANRLTASKAGYSDDSEVIPPHTQGTIPGVVLRLSSGFDLAGRVTDSDGRPPGRTARVFLHLGRRFREATPDDEGRFEFKGIPIGSELEVSFSSSTNFLPRRPVEEPEIEARFIELKLSPPVVLAGRVLTPSGSAALGGTVRLTGAGLVRAQSFPVGAGGRWESGPLPPGSEFSILVEPPPPSGRREIGEMDFLTDDGNGVHTAEVNPWPKGYRSRFRIRLDPSGRVEMQRTDEGDGGFEGTVRYRGQLSADGRSISGEVYLHGDFTPGRFQMRSFRDAGGLGGTWELREELPPEAPVAPAATRLTTAPFPSRQVVRLQFAPSHDLRGTVTRPDGSPVQNGRATVDGWSRSELFRLTETVTNGEFSFNGLPGEPLRLVIWDEDGGRSEPLWIRPGGPRITIRIGSEHLDEMDELDR